MTTNDRRSGRLRAATLLVALAMALGACASAGPGVLNNVGAPIDNGATSGTGGQPAMTAAPGEPAGGNAGQPPADDGNGPPSALREDLKVVFTGSLDLVVDALQPALAQARAAVAAAGGYIGASQETNDGDVSVATITYRIPAARWEDTVVALRGLATRVVDERTQATEVGSQLVDIEARLRNLRASEGVLVGIAETTGKVADLLEVQARITDVRGQIEQLDAQRAQLEDQVAYGTLVTTFGTEVVQVQAAAKGWDPQQDLDGATATLIEAGQSIVSGAIWFTIVWLPVILVLAVAALLLRWAIRRFFPSARPAGAISGWGGEG